MIPEPNTIYTGDCVETMQSWPEADVDAIVCDPPYFLEFMGRDWDRVGGDAGMSKPGIGARPTEWPAYGGSEFGGSNPTCEMCGGRARGSKRCECDDPDWRVKGEALSGKQLGSKGESARQMQAWHETWAREALRVAKPGAYLLAFGGTRTWHRLAAAIEDAGWVLEPTIAWSYASGFPKSLNIGKAIDRAAGAEREVVGYDESRARPNRKYEGGAIGNIGGTGKVSDRTDNGATHTAPATPEAAQWDGWGTALKPAFEPVVVARKPGPPLVPTPDVRFILVPKASRADREPLITPDGHDITKRFVTHPTVKATDLMRVLVRIATPPGGMVLDCFLGSGSTAVAAELEGLNWVGIERDASYVEMANARLHGRQRGLALDVGAASPKPKKAAGKAAKTRPARAVSVAMFEE